MGSDPASEAELRERMLEELARTRVHDLLLQTVFTLSTVAGARLGLDEDTLPLRDLDEAKQAIDALGALVPALGRTLEPGELDQVRQMVAGLQLGYANALQAAGPARPSVPTGAPPPPPPPPPDGPSAGEQPRPRIWTPRGDV